MKDHGLQESTDFNPKTEIEPQISQMALIFESF